MGWTVRLAGVAAILSAWPGAAAGAGLAAPADPAADSAAQGGWVVGASGETIFEHTRASLRDPHFGIRVYRDHQVPGTLHDVPDPTAPGADALAAAPNGNHTFFDVAFGEHLPILTWFNVNPAHSRYARGVSFNLDAAAFLLLDFDSQSSGVIDTDFRIGGSIDLRPWVSGLDHLSLSTGYFHESSHLGDEYVLSAATIQAGAVPSVNPALPYRANPSYEALPVTLSLDVPLGGAFSGRLYGGAEKYFDSQLPTGSLPTVWRAGGELRWTSVSDRLDAGDVEQPTWVQRALTKLKERSVGRDAAIAPQLRRRRGPFGVELAYEMRARRRYEHVGTDRTATFVDAPGFFYVQHATLMGLYNLDTAHSSSNALGLSVDWIRGRSPFGQLIEYATVDAFAVGLSYYW